MLAGDCGEHRLHVGRRQVSQQDAPEIGNQVQPHVRGVTAQRGGPWPLPGRQPKLQPLAYRHRRSVIAGNGHLQPRQRPLGIGTGLEPAAADPAPPRVRALR